MTHYRRKRFKPYKPEVLTMPKELEDMHARMRQRDRERLESGEATAQQIQDENSILPKFTTFRILKLTV